MMSPNPCPSLRDWLRGALRTSGGRALPVAGASLVVVLLVQPAVRTQPQQSEHLEFGSPGGSCVPLNKRFFISCYDNARRIPQWVSYRLRSSDLSRRQARTDDFRADETLDEDVR